MFIRFTINGIFAASVHFMVLWILVDGLNLRSVGFSNFIAAVIGISVSFVGNKYFVFPAPEEKILFMQILKFFCLYLSLAFLNGGLMFVWSDVFKFNYVSGFFICLFVQVMFSFFGSKYLVFGK